MTTVTIEEAQARLPKLIAEMPTDSTIVITRNQHPVAELRARAPEKPRPVFGSCKGMLTIIAEDDEHLEDFKEYNSPS